MGGQQAEEERSTGTSTRVPTCTSGFGQLLAVVIAGVANDGVNVICARLRSVLDQKRWALGLLLARYDALTGVRVTLRFFARWVRLPTSCPKVASEVCLSRIQARPRVIYRAEHLLIRLDAVFNSKTRFGVSDLTRWLLPSSLPPHPEKSIKSPSRRRLRTPDGSGRGDSDGHQHADRRVGAGLEPSRRRAAAQNEHVL